LESDGEQLVNMDLFSLNPEESYINLLKQHNGLWCIDESCHCFVMFDISVELNVLRVCKKEFNTTSTLSTFLKKILWRWDHFSCLCSIIIY